MNIFLIAIKNLFCEKGRLLITIGGVAFSVTLILVLLGLYQGWNKQIVRFLGSIQTEYWVGQQGSRDISHSVSLLAANLESSVEALPSVEKLSVFIGRQVSFKKDGKEIRILLVETSPNNIIKPYKVVKGKDNPDTGEVIIDETIANQEKIKLGDKVLINDVELRVVGISSGGNVLVYSYAFTSPKDARKILELQGFVNYFLIDAENKDKLEKDLKTVITNPEIMTKQEFLDENAAIIKDTFLPMIGVLFLIALAIGIAVIGLTIYTATIEKSKENGILKAIGYSNGQLFSIVFIQSITAGLLGLLFGNLLTIIVVKFAKMASASFIYEINTKEIALVAVAALLMSLLASFIPLKKLTSVDPASVFKA